MTGLGETICNQFYFPYAEKLWGLHPEEIASEQAFKRISSNSVFKIVKKALGAVFRGNNDGGAYFYYPRNGFGQIFLEYAAAISKSGGRMLVDTEVKKIDGANPNYLKIEVKRIGDKANTEFRFDRVFSTIPITNLTEMLAPTVPQNIRTAAAGLTYRGMLFHYLILKTGQFTPYDAHYFPEQKYLFSRISEPKNFYNGKEPRDITGICCEIPYSDNDRISALNHEELTNRILSDLNECGLKITMPILDVFVIKRPAVYPIYDLNYESKFRILDQYLGELKGLVTLGRQGLFVHDNVHHVLSMGYKATQCLEDDLTWNESRWRQFRQEFKNHVVVD